MTHDNDAIDTVPSEVDDLDVEGHGMKEVALGLSAATLVAAGGGAALAADHSPVDRTASGAKTTISAVQQTAAGAQGDLRDVAGSSRASANRAAQTGLNAVTPIGVQAQQLVNETGGAAVDRAGAIASDPMGETDAALDQAMSDARNLRDGAVDGARDTASTATTRAGQTVAKTEAAALAAADRATDRAGATTQAAGSTAGSAQQKAQRIGAGAVTTAEGLVGEDTGAKAERSGGSTTVGVTAAGHEAEVTVG